MRNAGFRGCPKRRFRITTQRDPRHGWSGEELAAARLQSQGFPIDIGHQTLRIYQPRQGWLYLAVVMDLYSRRIVGWSMDRHRLSRHIVMDALAMAITRSSAGGADLFITPTEVANTPVMTFVMNCRKQGIVMQYERAWQLL